MKRLIRRLLAIYRLSNKAVCAESEGMGLTDYHDYPDTKEKEPWHFTVLTCERCGKKFTI